MDTQFHTHATFLQFVAFGRGGGGLKDQEEVRFEISLRFPASSCFLLCNQATTVHADTLSHPGSSDVVKTASHMFLGCSIYTAAWKTSQSAAL